MCTCQGVQYAFKSGHLYRCLCRGSTYFSGDDSACPSLCTRWPKKKGRHPNSCLLLIRGRRKSTKQIVQGWLLHVFPSPCLPAWATSNSSDLPQPVRPSTQAWPVLYWHDFLPSTTYTCFLFCPLQCNAQKRELITRGSQPAPMPPKPGRSTTVSPTTRTPVPLPFSTVPCLPHQFNALPTPEYKIYSPYVSVPTMCLRGPFASSSISSSSSERHSVQ